MTWKGSVKDIYKGNALDSKILMQISLEIAKGMSFLIRNDIIHRDLKSDNVMLNNNMNCKLVDFGISLVRSRKDKDKKGSVVGTPVVRITSLDNVM